MSINKLLNEASQLLEQQIAKVSIEYSLKNEYSDGDVVWNSGGEAVDPGSTVSVKTALNAIPLVRGYGFQLELVNSNNGEAVYKVEELE